MAKAFIILTYSYTEIAMNYLRHLTPDYASKQLRRWIRHNKQLQQELTASGWISGQRLLTPLQVTILVRYLGEPGWCGAATSQIWAPDAGYFLQFVPVYFGYGLKACWCRVKTVSGAWFAMTFAKKQFKKENTRQPLYAGWKDFWRKSLSFFFLIYILWEKGDR